MTKLATLALLAALSVSLSACCSSSEARFWQLRDAATGRTAYAVDTAHVQLGRIEDKYVDASGRFVRVDHPEVVRQLSESEYSAATGGAGFGVHYCPSLRGCWAIAHDK